MQAPLQARNDADAVQTDTARMARQERSLVDKRSTALVQCKLAEMMNASPSVLQQQARSDAIHNSPRMVAQRHEMNALFGGAARPQGDGMLLAPQDQQDAQSVSVTDRDGPAQLKYTGLPSDGPPTQPTPPSNRTGLPDQLKSGIESLSGLSLDAVRVHYNSDKPAQLQAHAYAQGSEIHLGAGQERHLPHEAWHVVQQAQGRVRPTLQMKAGVVNDDPSLEKEADMMGEKAVQFASGHVARTPAAGERIAGAVTQRVAGFSPNKSSDVISGSGNIVQCYGQLRFANLDNDPKYQTKGAAIIAALQATPNIQQFLIDKNALIVLESTPELASVIVTDDQVRIKISPWFFEQQSRGRIIGMLAHEFGVHPLARQALTVPERNQEALDIAQDTAFPTGLAGHTITPGAAGQTDHVFAAVAGQPRFISYQLTAYQMANAMYLQSLAPAPDMTGAHVTDQIMTYLSDIAMILATNDHRGQIVLQPQRTADAFNLVRGAWLGFLGGQPNGAQLTALTPGGKTKSDVLGEVAGLAGRFILSIGTGSKDNSQVEQTKNGWLNPVYADLTSAQTGVLVDHNLILQPKNLGQPTPSFLDALDDVTGNPAGFNRVWVRAAIHNAMPHGDPVVHADLGLLEQKLANNSLESPISSDSLHYIAHFLARTIRIMKSNGQMEVRGNGARLTLLEVSKPALHYRFST